MKKKITDKQIDRLLKGILTRSQATTETIDEVADAPQVWWAVQREIATQKDAQRTPWPPPFRWVRFLSIAVPSFAVLLIAIAFVTFRPVSDPPSVVATGTGDLSPSAAKDEPSIEPTKVATPEPVVRIASNVPTPERVVRAVAPIKKIHRNISPDSTTVAATPKTEIKSDFIALSYARSPESGQIVRVRVPGSMKVSLGIASSVDNPNDLVDAEVLVGDDGLTRAIRFIRQ